MSEIQYTWEFPALDVKYSDGEMTNVVNTVHWRLNATDGVHTVSTYGSIGVPEPTPEAFVSYDDLTKEEVQSWVESAMRTETPSVDGTEEAVVVDGVQELYENLARQIAVQKAPVSGTLTPPWNLADPASGDVI
jgi:hypothetical protein